MSQTAPVTDTLERVEKGRVPIIHRFPADPAYRLSGMSPPQPGDIARCGWRKKSPAHGRTGIMCVVCDEMSPNVR